jgi:hypothetical protein
MHICMHIRIPRRLVISAPAEAGLALEVFILPPTSSFLRMFYLLDSSVNISTCLSTLVFSYIKILLSHVVPSQDLSEALPQPRVRDEDSDPFMLALGLWCEEAGISRTQYSSLREILRMLEPHSILNRLSKNYASLRRKTKGWLPQLQLRRALLSLNVSKMPSLAEQQKKHATADSIKEYLYFFDPVDLFQRILKFRLTEKMHFGFGEFRTHPIELWQSSA